MNAEDRIKLFGMSHGLVERDLDAVEESFKVDLQRKIVDDKDEDYYPQFSFGLRSEASEMGRHYELFYCLEKSIRELVAETLKASNGEQWWENSVPQIVQQNAKQNIKRELDSGYTQRSEEEIDYTTFGELGEIVRKNWADFGGIFSSEKAFTKIMNSLNMLRGPIAHCCPLAEDEVVRLKLTMKDWFRLME
ncbi:Swt1 family HEPN domain-containing protein [Coraliomargarita sp. W4R53]